MSAQVYSMPGQSETEDLFGMENHILILWAISYTWGNVNYYKSAHHPIPTRENRKHLGNFQNELVSSAFK